MENRSMIPLELLCTHYNIEFSFINSLQEFGLVEVTTVQEIQYIREEQISDLERMLRLHYDLDINIAGIDVVFNLLQHIENLQKEIKSLKNRLSFYEE